MSEKLSSRVQGLKFMQRGAQRAALAQGKDAPGTAAPPAVPAPEPAPSAAADTADAADAATPAASEQWFVPADRRVRIATPPVQDASNWDAWLVSTDTDDAPRASACRQQLGKWKGKQQTKHKKQPKNDDDNDDDDDDAHEPDLSESDDGSSDYQSAPGSPAESGFRKPPSAADPPRKRPAPTAARGTLRKKPLRGRFR
ncbi:hypothetical protein MCUN1_002331 [Malassezia cuniculi]|uniref:Uncharacterized protein n=1 Tax=Malassezia cuniculi TaxID=948313 RepID=A0AAF0J6V7_9BASI|nr:hypothetical protein MCUN1_002331 [Malassezia cuniculi]